MTAVECYGDQHDLPKNEELRKVIVNLRDSSESSHQPSSSSSPQDFPEDPGLSVLIDTPEQSLKLHIQSARASKINRTAKMADQQDEPPPSGEVLAEQDTSPLEIVTKPDDRESKSSIDSGVGLDVSDLLPEKEQPDQVLPTKELATRTRSDSMQQAEQPCPRSDLGSSLRISVSTSNADAAPSCEKDDSICASPTLSKHVIPSADIHGESLAPFEPFSPSASSPKAERLPSIHQITSSLTELAEAATQEMPRQQQNIAHHHSHSFGSATSQSPVLSNRPYPIAIQTSPQAYYPPTMLARSPTITIGESQYASPPPYASYGAYSHRRASAADAMPPLMPNLPTTSSSGDSYGGYLSSSTEGYSTNHTTPVDIGQVSESTPRPMLPPPPGMHAGSQPLPAPIMIPGPYKCDVPNCTAGTFQTQYLLNSHKNVHSQSRPHYCPVAGCPRSEGGKGFKRKNEMIRHGLVHNSPGYICPFCPEREHRYPRPDNLQRHVRVHHVNKDRDDNVLRDVLNQRTEGQGKTRRRRTNTGPMATGSL